MLAICLLWPLTFFYYNSFLVELQCENLSLNKLESNGVSSINKEVNISKLVPSSTFDNNPCTTYSDTGLIKSFHRPGKASKSRLNTLDQRVQSAPKAAHVNSEGMEVYFQYNKKTADQRCAYCPIPLCYFAFFCL